MMKFKKPRISIKVKIWLAIIAIVMAVIAALWILQVVFLQTNYLKAKAKNLEEQTRLIAQTVNEKGILNSADFLKKAAWENMLCIDFSNPSGFDLVTVEGLGDNCYVHTNQLNRLRLIQAAASAKGEYVLLEYNHPLYNSRYYSCAVANQTQPDGSEYVLIVLSLIHI